MATAVFDLICLMIRDVGVCSGGLQQNDMVTGWGAACPPAGSEGVITSYNQWPSSRTVPPEQGALAAGSKVGWKSSVSGGKSSLSWMPCWLVSGTSQGEGHVGAIPSYCRPRHLARCGLYSFFTLAPCSDQRSSAKNWAARIVGSGSALAEAVAAPNVTRETRNHSASMIW